MNKIKLSILMIMICISVLGFACASANEEVEDNKLVISDDAVKYDFPSDNILKYKGIIVEDDHIVYVFGRFSEFTKALKERDDMKIFTKYYDESNRKYTTEWKLVEDTDVSYLIIYCNPDNYDFDAGIMISNYLNEVGTTYDYSKATMTSILIQYLQNPRLLIRNLTENEKIQSFNDGKWSDVFENTHKTLD